MQSLVKDYDHLVFYFDGSAREMLGNKAKRNSGAGFAVYGQNYTGGSESEDEPRLSDSEEEEEIRLQRLNEQIFLDGMHVQKEGGKENFLFGASLHLGHCSNNYAEYIGLILSQLFGVLLRQNQITLYGDSQLVV